MLKFGRWIPLLGVPFVAWPHATVLGQAPAVPLPTTNAVHVLGIENLKRNAKCKLTLQGGMMQFERGQAKAELSIASIRDVFTGQDSKRMVELMLGGPLGTISTMAAPYETGRIISLFRTKIDVLTVEYVDANGGLHGAVFTLPKGQAPALKKQLVAQGARTSTPVDEEVKQPKDRVDKKP